MKEQKLTEFGRGLRRYYPDAITNLEYQQRIYSKLKFEHGLDIDKMLLTTSICADDVIITHADELDSRRFKWKRDYLGPFSMGGLAGLPYSGITGLTAAAHHVPETGGSMLIAYGPHVGINDAGELGRLLRPEQEKETSACGALLIALNQLQKNPKGFGEFREDDLEQSALERRLLPYREQILAAPNPLKAITDATYDIIHSLMLRYVSECREQFYCEFVALVGGVLINTSQSEEDYVDLRYFEVFRVADL